MAPPEFREKGRGEDTGENGTCYIRLEELWSKQTLCVCFVYYANTEFGLRHRIEEGRQ